MTRTQLTIQDVFKNKKYQYIIHVICVSESFDKPLQFLHLRYIFCKKHGLNLNSYEKQKIKDYLRPSKTLEERVLMARKQDSKDGYIPIDNYQNVLKLRKETIIDEIKISFRDFDKYKYNSYQSLGNSLKRLKDLNIITTKKERSGYPRYHLTPNGMYHYNLWWMKWNINRLFPDTLLLSSDVDTMSNREKIIMDLQTELTTTIIVKISKIVVKMFRKD